MSTNPVPDNITKFAAEVWGSMPKEGAGIDHLARAMWQVQQDEREACASIADNQSAIIRLGGFSAWHGGSNIANAIRDRNAA